MFVTKKKKEPSGLQPIRSSTKVKRNQPCPCESGKKAKHCCLRKIRALEAIPAHLRSQLIVDTILQRPIVSVLEEPTHPESVDAADCKLEIISKEKQP